MFKENNRSLKRIPAEVLFGMSQREPKVKFLSSSWQLPQPHPDKYQLLVFHGGKRVKKDLGGPPAVTWLSTMGLCEVGGRKRDCSLRIKEMPVIPKTKESAKQKSQSMLVLIGKMENQLLELELAKLSWDYSTNSIHLLSALLLTLMDQVGTYKANDMVPFTASLYNLSPLPWGGLGHQRPGQTSGETELASQHLLCVVSQLAPRWGEHFWQ